MYSVVIKSHSEEIFRDYKNSLDKCHQLVLQFASKGNTVRIHEVIHAADHWEELNPVLSFKVVED